MKLDDLSVTFGLEMLTSDEREDRGKVSTAQQPLSQDPQETTQRWAAPNSIFFCLYLKKSLFYELGERGVSQHQQVIKKNNYSYML